MSFRNIWHAFQHAILGWRYRLPSKNSVAKSGRVDGEVDRPRVEDVDLNASQQKILNASKNAITGVRQHIEGELRRCDEKFNQPEYAFSDLDIAKPNVVAHHELTNYRAQGNAERGASRQSVDSARNELTQFQTTHRLGHRSAKYPEFPLLGWGLLFVLFGAEVIFSGGILGEHDARGLLGGWWQAFLISVINIGPALMVGIHACRHLHHIDSAYRRRAVAGLMFGCAWLLFLNLYVAHYRIALGIDLENAVWLAGQHMSAGLFNITESADAVFLFGLGIFAAFLTVIDGYRVLDDPYPKYGAITRQYHKTALALENLKRRQVRDVESVVAYATDEIDDALKQLDKRAAKANALINVAMLCARYCEDRAVQISRLCNELITSYREENVRIRTQDVPAYFTERVSLNTDLGCSSDALHERRATIKVVVAEKRNEALHALEELHRTAERDIAHILDDRVHVPDDGTFPEIERRAS